MFWFTQQWRYIDFGNVENGQWPTLEWSYVLEELPEPSQEGVNKEVLCFWQTLAAEQQQEA